MVFCSVLFCFLQQVTTEISFAGKKLNAQGQLDAITGPDSFIVCLRLGAAVAYSTNRWVNNLEQQPLRVTS